MGDPFSQSSSTSTIRVLNSSDAVSYQALRLLALSTDADAYFSTYEEASKLPLFAFEQEVRTQPVPFGYYGWFEDGLQAYVSLQMPYFEKQQHTADIFNLYVHPDFRKRGIARTMVRHLIDRSYQIPKIEALFLSVMDGNTKAIQLYEGLGFQVYGNKEHALKSGTRYVNELYMRLDLKSIDMKPLSAKA